MKRGVVYVVAKAPTPGACKTRLCPPLSYDEAAQLAEAFLLDVLATVRQAGLAARIVCRDRSEQSVLRRLVGQNIRVWAQHGAGLGDALEGAMRTGLADGYEVAAVLGADTPTITAEVLNEGYLRVESGQCDVSLGPSDDGGYYLLAARAVHPTLFRSMVWSTDSVAAETLARCRLAGLRTHLLPRWYDVDDAASLAGLREELAVAGATAVAPHTRTLLASLDSVRSGAETGLEPANQLAA